MTWQIYMAIGLILLMQLVILWRLRDFHKEHNGSADIVAEAAAELTMLELTLFERAADEWGYTPARAQLDYMEYLRTEQVPGYLMLFIYNNTNVLED